MPKYNLKDRVALITGSSRGIGKAIADRLAREGVKVVITGKTTKPHPKLRGTIYSSLEDIKAEGGDGIALPLDVREESGIEQVIEETIKQLGRLDILVNNASAIHLADTSSTPVKRFDLMQQVNVRATWIASKLAIPHLEKSDNPHILTLSPPLNMAPHWFSGHLAYTLSKYGMSMCVLGLAGELKDRGIGVNALWPSTLIATAAIENLLGGEAMLAMSRTPAIVAEAALEILRSSSRENTGNFYIDEDLLRQRGWKDFSEFHFKAGSKLQMDLFLDPE